MVKIFADGADRASILELNKNPFVEGFTTNPSLLRKAGVTDYKEFALDILSVIRDKPISFEVIADDNYEMYRQALEIASWGENVYVKIPITNTEGKSTEDVIRRLDHVNLNVTAITTIKQVRRILPSLKKGFISIFAGRIADTGINPLPIMKSALKLINGTKVELIWASPREVFNVYQAQEIGCHVITCTPDLIKKMSLQGKDLTEYSLDTVRMFYNDAKESGLKL